MTEPKNISQDFIAPPAALASFDWQDLASGLNYNTYYAFRDGANVYGLSDQTIYSDIILAFRDGAGTATYTFNSSVFQNPLTTKGTAIINVPLSTQAGCAGYATAEVVHMRGAVATSLGTATGIAAPLGASEMRIQCLQIALTEQHFKKGDHLRLVIEIVNTASNIIWTAHDPAGRASTPTSATAFDTTILAAHVPFKTTE